MLGGRSEAGFPVLYGDAKQKLKQLEGYGGELIEEMKQKLKKEIKETASASTSADTTPKQKYISTKS